MQEIVFGKIQSKCAVTTTAAVKVHSRRPVTTGRVLFGQIKFGAESNCALLQCSLVSSRLSLKRYKIYPRRAAGEREI